MAGGHNLLYEFVSEAKEHLANVTDDLLALEQKQDENARFRVDRVFRAIHSVKGGAGFFGCRRVEELAHALETVLDPLRATSAPLAANLIDTLLAAADRIQALLDDVEHSNEADVSDILARLQGGHHPAPPEAVEFRLTEPPLVERPAHERFLYGLTINLGDCHLRQGLNPGDVLDRVQRAGTIVNARLITPIGDLQSPLSMRGLLYQALLSSRLAPEVVRTTLDLTVLELAVLETPPTPPVVVEVPVETPAPAVVERAGNTIRIPVELVDRLMTLAGELVLVRNQALRSQAGVDPTFRPVLQRLDGVTSDLQDAVMRTRMQPVGNLFGRFPRLVRDLARQLDKDIEIDVAGTEVELDKTILEHLSDPLTHLIRNACDHGIETPALRQQAGKPPVGHIQLNAKHLGGQIFIEIRDDGKGIDHEAIKRKAVQQSLRTPAELARMSDKEVLALILLPGFSTATVLTDVSGRGVGMDVVKTNLDRMGGSLEIDSVLGRGTTFALRLPLTLAIIPCLLVTSAGERYAVPQKDLEELAYLSPNQVGARIEIAHDQEVLRWRDRLLPLVRLNEVMARPRPFTPATRAQILKGLRGHQPHALYLAVVKVGSQRFGLLVDEILTTEEIVVKPMHSALKKLGCFAGATILGDGRVALIVSIEGVARHAGVQYDLETEHPTSRPTAAVGETQTTLLFRYGPREQFALPLAMIRRIELMNPSRIEKAGNQEFLTVDGVSTEVLRLDRFLSVSVPEQTEMMFLILPKNLRRPLGILTAEIIDTAELGLALDSEAYRPDGLLGSAIVRGQMTLFLDVYRLADLLASLTPRAPTPPALDRRQVLLVEDTQFFQQLVKGYLEARGFAVTLAGNGAEGLLCLDKQTFDLVISDIEMPVMDGWTFARALRQRPEGAQQRLLALTTLNSAQDRAKALACGFDRHEVKIDREKFLAAVEDLLAS